MKYYRIETANRPVWAREEGERLRLLVGDPLTGTTDSSHTLSAAEARLLTPGDMITTGTPSGIGLLEAGGRGGRRRPSPEPGALTPGRRPMPLYEYVCADCEARFERYVSTWGEAVACPECSSGAVEKQLSRFAMSGPATGRDAGSGGAGGGCCGGSSGCAH